MTGMWLPLALLALLGYGVWLWTPLFDPRPGVRLLVAATTTSAMVVAIQVVLGFAGAIRTLPLGGAATGIAALLVGGAWFRRLVGRELPADPVEPPGRLEAGLWAGTALFYVGLFVVGLGVPPYPWDTMTYHLADVFHYAQSGSLEPFPAPLRPLYYPKAGELHSLWFYILSGAGSEAWRTTGIALLPVALTAGIAVRVSAGALGFGSLARWLGPAMMLTPVVMIQPLALYVDAAFAAFTLASFAFALLAAREGRWGFVAWCALAGGLAMGTKISFVYFSLPILLVLSRIRVLQGLVSHGLRRMSGRLAVCILLFLVGCGYWLGRNFLEYGNPLYPVKVEVGGVVIFDGPKTTIPSKRQQGWFVPDTASWARYPLYETQPDVPNYTMENGFGPLFAAAYVATPVALFIAVRRRRWLLTRVVLAWPLTIALWLMVNPYQEPRYVIAVAGFGLLVLAMIAEEVDRGIEHGEPTMPEEGRSPPHLSASPPRTAPGRWIEAAVAVGVVFGACSGLASAAPDLDRVVREIRERDWHPTKYYRMQYYTAGDAFNWLSEQPVGVVTATNLNLTAPLFGWHGRNRVVYAPTLPDLPIGPADLRATYRAWRRAHYRWGTDRIVEWRSWWEEGDDPHHGARWLREHPEDFRLLAQFSSRVRVWEPIFTAAEIAAMGEPSLDRLARPESWELEYTEGTVIEWREGIVGIRIEYDFQTRENDYSDLRAIVDREDFAKARRFSFEIEGEPQPTLLFVYLKERNLTENARYRFDMSELTPGRNRVTFNLRAPDGATENFDPARTREVHLILDDKDNTSAHNGYFRIWDFQIEAESTEALP